MQTNDVLTSIHADVRLILGKLGISSMREIEISQEITLVIQQRLGGSRPYIPVLRSNSIRRAQIREEFTGNNHADLCRRHGVSLRHIYRLLGD